MKRRSFLQIVASGIAALTAMPALTEAEAVAVSKVRIPPQLIPYGTEAYITTGKGGNLCLKLPFSSKRVKVAAIDLHNRVSYPKTKAVDDKTLRVYFNDSRFLPKVRKILVLA